jgi:hypothetical protein
MPRPENSTTPNPLLEYNDGALPLVTGMVFETLHPARIIHDNDTVML